MLVGRLSSASKGCRLGSSACVLFSLVHLLFELFGLLFVDEAQASQAFLEFECMKKSSVLVVIPCIEDLLVPNDSSIGRLGELASNSQAWQGATRGPHHEHTEISTILIQYVFPTRSFTSATAPCIPV